MRILHRGLRVSGALAVIAAAAIPAMTVHHAAAAVVGDCTGQYWVSSPDTTGLVGPVLTNNNWIRSCATVNTAGSPSIFGDVTVVPDTTGNGFDYTGNCLLGFIQYPTSGAIGAFVGGVVSITDPHGNQFLAVTEPGGVPCLGTPGSFRTWSGVSTFVF